MNKFIFFCLFAFLLVVGNSSYGYCAVPQSVEEVKKADSKKNEESKKKSKDKKVKKIALLAQKTDTIVKSKQYLDSLRVSNPFEFILDSLTHNRINLDSVNLDSISRRFFTDTMRVTGGVVPMFNTQSSIANVRKLDSLITQKSILEKKRMKALGLRKDTMSLVTTTAISLFVPGFAQIRNRDYWKVPVLYGTAGGFVGLGFWSNGKSKSAFEEYQNAIKLGLPKSEIDRLHIKSNKLKTQTTLFFAGAALSYLYFLSDGITNYNGKVKAPTKAALMGLFIPGGGQFYNKSYWKIPIYYGSLAALGYVVSYNNNGYNRYKNAYNAATDNDPMTKDEFNGQYSPEQLRNLRNDFKRSRDLSIFYLTGVYVLGVIEAYVDASFKSYDISDNLSMKIRPSVGFTEMGAMRNSSSVFGNATVGVSVDIKLK